MGIKNHYDDGVPLRFAHQYLMSSPAFTAFYGNKLFEPSLIPPKPGEQFVIVHAVEDEVILHAGIAEYIAKVACRLDVICIHKYPTGSGSEMQFRQQLKMLRAALCGHCGVDVFELDGITKIGEVDESRYLGKVPFTMYRDGQFDVLQKGISLRLVYR